MSGNVLTGRKSIVIVENEPTWREREAAALKEMGYRTSPFPTSVTANDYLRGNKGAAGFVLGDGIGTTATDDTFALLYRLREFSQAPAIVVSDSQRDAQAVRGLGNCTYLDRKGFTDADFKAEAERLFGRPAYRILIVDDEPNLRKLGQILLQRVGYDVVTAANGLEALDVLARDGVDAVVTDNHMPEMWGYQLVEQVRGSDDPRINGLPIAMFSSRFEDGDKNPLGTRLTEHGVAMVDKPFQPDEYISAVNKLLKVEE